MLSPKKTFTYFCVLLILSALTGSSWGFSRAPEEPAVVPGKVLVKFHDGVTAQRITEIVEAVGGATWSVLGSTDIRVIELAVGVDVTEAVEKLTSYKEVNYAQQDERAQPLEEK